MTMDYTQFNELIAQLRKMNDQLAAITKLLAEKK